MELIKIGNYTVKLVENGRTIVRAYGNQDGSWTVSQNGELTHTTEIAAKELFKVKCAAALLSSALS